MKKYIKFIIFSLLIFNYQFLFSQIASGLNYQAVIRNNAGELLKNHIVKARFTILDDENTVIFTESNAFNTNEYGLINIVIGRDNPAFENINWSNGPYDLKVEIDTGSGFEDLGTTKIYAVPYANLAKDVVNNDDADADPSNEIQLLSFDAETNKLSISNGNSIAIPTGGTDADADPANEIQTLTKSGNQIILSKEGGSVTDEVNDADADPANELQTLSVLGDQLTISSGNTVTLPSSSTGDQWGSQVVQSDYSLSGDGTINDPLRVNKNIIVFEKSGTTIHQISSYDTDDFILGREALPENDENVTGKMLFFDKSKAAFRAGELYASSNWSPDSIGIGSFASGYNTKASAVFSTAMGYGATASRWGATAMGEYTTASGTGATAMGESTTASGYDATAMGLSTTASGYISTAMGAGTTAPSGYETVLGRYNTGYSPNSATGWDDDDRLFVIGNGSYSSHHNALTLKKKGFLGLNNDDPGAEFQITDTNKDGSDNDVVLRLQSEGANHDAIIEFYENTSEAMSLHYDGGDNALYITDLATSPDEKRLKIVRSTGSIIPQEHKKADLGSASLAFDDIYYDDLHNEGASAFLDRSPAKEILSYPPQGKSPGDFDYKTEKGDVELDPKSMPPGLADENSLFTDEIVSYNYKANYEQQLIIENQQQTIRQQDERIKQLQDKLQDQQDKLQKQQKDILNLQKALKAQQKENKKMIEKLYELEKYILSK